jgi:integrase
VGYIQRGDSWRVSVSYKGDRRTDTVATEEEAKARAEEIRAEMVLAHRKATTPATSGSAAAQPEMRPEISSWKLSHACDKTFELHWNGTKSAWWYKLKCKVLLAHFGDDKPLHEIDTDAVDAFRQALKDKGNGQATINHHLAALSMVFKIAHKRGGVAMKPVLGIKKATRVRMRWLSEKEEAIMAALFEQWKKLDQLDWLRVLVDTGMRPEETQQMTGRWCDFKLGLIHVQPEGTWVPKTLAGIRGIPMTTRVKAILERRCLIYKLDRLFPFPWDRFTNQWHDARKAMGLENDRDFVPYSTRHTFGTRLVQRGVDITVIKDLMGHEDIKQTMQYAKRGAAQYVAAIAALEPTP